MIMAMSEHIASRFHYASINFFITDTHCIFSLNVSDWHDVEKLFDACCESLGNDYTSWIYGQMIYDADKSMKLFLHLKSKGFFKAGWLTQKWDLNSFRIIFH